jgi:LemA protein
MNKGGCVLVGAGVLALAIVVGLWAMGVYNGLVQSEEGVKTAWAQVENVYQRRMDLIPNLVETVKGVAEFERETYTAVTEARAQAGQMKLSADVLDDPQAFARLQQAQGQLSTALSRLFAVAENYPQLKANQNFLELQSQLEGAQAFNTRLRVFPNNVVGGLFGFRARPYFEATPGAETPPKVEF